MITWEAKVPSQMRLFIFNNNFIGGNMSLTSVRIQQRNNTYLRQFEEELRTDFAVELRKQKRNEFLKQKRQKKTEYSQIDMQVMPKLLENYNKILVSSTNYSEIFEILKAIRILSSFNPNPPLEMLMQSKVIENLIHTLDKIFPVEILEEASWILCNMAAGNTDIVEILISLGTIEQCIELLFIDSYFLIENII